MGKCSSFAKKHTSMIRPYQINLTFHWSADSVFMTNKKKVKNVFDPKHIKCGGKAMVLPVHIVSLAESITMWSLSRMAAPFIVVTTADIRSWREHLSTCFFPEVLGLSQTANFPSFFRTGSSCFTLCSPSHDPVSISKLSSFINVSTFISSNNGSYIISSSPPLYFPLLITTVVSPAHLQALLFNCPFAKTDFTWLLMRLVHFKWDPLFPLLY